MSARPAIAFVAVFALAAACAAGTVEARMTVSSSAAGPAVQVMIVGSGDAILAGARVVSASATSVRVGGRSCSVAGGTPLAALVAMRRAGGPGFALRDYGHCGAAPADSAELFVDSLGGEANRGEDGWEYKVAGVSGSTGAADPSGPAGDGRRLRAGTQVLWFWCKASGGGCQRTLEAGVSASTVAPGGSVGVRVLGRENEGRAVPIAGAIVTLGSDFASTAADGRATLTAPSAPGRYGLQATRVGLVPSFPEAISVR